MKFHRSWIIAAILAGCLPLASCKPMPDEEEEVESPAKIDHINGEDKPAQITLEQDAVERIDLKTEPVTEEDANGAKQKVIPYAALMYEANGNTWTFTNPKPLVYIREPVKVDHIEGGKAYLTEGPAPGTQVVTLGAAELYGSEVEFEEE